MNWGNRLLVVFLVFAAGMGYLFYRSVNTNYDLVENDYYTTELRYQQVIDDTKRADSLSQQVTISQEPQGILINMPKEMKSKKLEGSIWFYCAYDRKYDRKFKLDIDGIGSQLIPSLGLIPGKYSVKISWKDQQTGYYTEKNLSVL
jgi:hypothetical protein